LDEIIQRFENRAIVNMNFCEKPTLLTLFKSNQVAFRSNFSSSSKIEILSNGQRESPKEFLQVAKTQYPRKKRNWD